MKINFLFFAVVFACFFFSPLFWRGAWNEVAAQAPGEWTWMHGNNTPNSLGVFGTQSVPHPANSPPALYHPCEWKDNIGNFWLFGGGGSPGTGNLYAALWRFNPVTNEWTWIKGPSIVNQSGVYGTQGVPSPANYPGARWLSVSWVDALGNLWLFGGKGYDAFGGFGLLNDLWKYNISTNEWTWIKGPNTIGNTGSYGTQGTSSTTNLPPSREQPCAWTDNGGALWLYGGSTIVDLLGDLWKYDISSNEWTWMHGANTPNPPPVYGTQGVAAPANTPGGKVVDCSWIDVGGNLWLFGGLLFSGGMNNDLWKYDIVVNQWTWIKGTNTTNDPGNYGTKCASTNNNMPPARVDNTAQVRDVCGNFWHFGGWVVPGGLFNDLWHYNTSTNQWTWVSGDNIYNQVAVYGTQGLSAPANKPGAKSGSVAWIDNNGYIWVFGGQLNGNRYNDLFRYVPDSACVPLSAAVITVSSNTTICMGQSATLTATGGTNYLWSPGGQNTSSIVVSPVTSTTYTVTNNACGSNSYTVTVVVNAIPTTTVSSTNVSCSGGSDGTATVTAAGGAPSYNYLWSPAGGTNSAATGLSAGVYTATVIDANGCTGTQSITIGNPAIPGELYLPNAFSPNGDEENDVLQIYYENYLCIKSMHIILYNRWGEKIYESSDPYFKWDGNHKGTKTNSTVFVYYMKAILISGEEIIKKGNISLMR